MTKEELLALAPIAFAFLALLACGFLILGGKAV